MKSKIFDKEDMSKGNIIPNINNESKKIIKTSEIAKRTRKLKRPQMNFLIDSAAFTFFVFLTVTGVLLHYVLPPGSARSTIWGLSRHDWGYLHFLVAIGLFGILAIHLFLHWKWIVCLVKGKPREHSGFRVGLGIVGLLALLGFSFTLLLQPVEVKSSHNKVNTTSTHKIKDLPIYGSMSLLEVSKSTDIPIDYFIKKLNLKSASDKNRTLGQLKKQYGFEINDVRKLINDYIK